MPPKKVMKLLPNQGKLNTFFNVNKDVNNNGDKNDNNDQSLRVKPAPKAPSPSRTFRIRDREKFRDIFSRDGCQFIRGFDLKKWITTNTCTARYAPTMTK